MRIVTVILVIVCFLSACQKHSTISFRKDNHNKIIALQPLADYDGQQLITVQNQLSAFFDMRVQILKPVDIPKRFKYLDEDKYSADSLIKFLSNLKNDTIAEVVGITSKEIYTVSEYTFKHNGNEIVTPYINSIFGLGYIAESTCVVSVNKLISPDYELFNNRMRKVIIHEVGHNLGLSHCNDDACLMSETNGNIANLNKAGGDYCKKCRQNLN